MHEGMPTRRTTIAATAVLAALAALTGCSGGSSSPPSTVSSRPPVTSASTSAVTTSASPSVSPPALPLAATKLDAKGAEAFARYWFEVVNYTFATRDTTLFRGLALPSCKFCAEFAGKVDARKSRGETYVGGVFTNRVAVSPGIDGSKTAVVDTQSAVSASKVLGASGAVLESDGGSQYYQVAIRLRPTTGKWMVDGVETQG